MTRERSGLGDRHRRERQRDIGMSQVVEADRLAPVAVQPCRLPCRVYGAERVTARLRLAAERREHKRIGVDAAKVFTATRERCACSSGRAPAEAAPWPRWPCS